MNDHWEAFIPDKHLLVLAHLLEDGSVQRVVRVELGEGNELPHGLPKHYESVSTTNNGRHILIVALDDPGVSWLFSTVAGAGIPCVSIQDLPVVKEWDLPGSHRGRTQDASGALDDTQVGTDPVI